MTLVGVGGAGVVYNGPNITYWSYKYNARVYLPLAGIETILGTLMLRVLLLALST